MRSIAVMVAKIVLLLSVGVLVYAGYQIVSAPLRESSALKEWEQLKQAHAAHADLSEEIIVPAGLVSPARTDENVLKPAQDEDGSTLQGGAPSDGPDDILGELYIPRLRKHFAILEGTESKQLGRGIGHYTGSSSLGSIGNSVLAGHRETVFRDLGRLQIGDNLEVTTFAGTLDYVITNTDIVDADERNAIVQSEDHLLTLVTCYPFQFVGTAPQRYLVTARLRPSS
ncbi:sortase A [Paenibacillus taihuensis]|uniref:Sortase A n=1 Tax=Paenibacillus taihuensis TaxID=1156355 RepID=A0A3D9SBA1_9BACL|nr:sortase [Paenibacillus taihuensis]REE90556.1 sortase A [Paenibacillus taihuensis]